MVVWASYTLHPDPFPFLSWIFRVIYCEVVTFISQEFICGPIPMKRSLDLDSRVPLSRTCEQFSARGEGSGAHLYKLFLEHLEDAL